MRSFGVVLLIPRLLIGLACATPFPLENPEEGITVETLRAQAPSSRMLVLVSLGLWL